MNLVLCCIKCISVLFLYFITTGRSATELVLQKRFKRERAFDLAHIESDLEEEERRRIRWQRSRMKDYGEFKDRMCQDKCNENLRRGLDMVKAHMAFGSIGVPPLIDESDLKLFCRLDHQHNRCLHDCGFEVQFNMHDFICKHHYLQMTYVLPCYAHAAAPLKRECGEKRCGPYTYLDNTVIGYAHRCRLLICDIKCATTVLIRQCGNWYGQRAAEFLMNYTRQQVSFWMQDLMKGLNHTMQNTALTTPRSCSRLLICRKPDLLQCFL